MLIMIRRIDMNGHECYIIGAGDFFGLREAPDDSDYVLAADAGYEHCRGAGIIPDLVIGDFDSLGHMPDNPNAMRLPVEKDDTDMMYAVKLGLQKGYRRFYIYGGTGGERPDHTMANLQTLVYISDCGGRGWLFGKDYVWTVLRNDSIKLRGSGTVSVFCPNGVAEGVSLEGLKYPLDGAALTSGFPLGVSNSMEKDEARISVVNGTLIIMYDMDIGEVD